MSFLFQPKLQIFSQGEQLVVLFDSNSPEDELRSTCALKMNSSFDRITTEVTSFDVTDLTAGIEDAKAYEGAIELAVYAPGSSEPTRHKLAAVRLVLKPARPRRRNTAAQFLSGEEVRNSVQHGVANAMSGALSEWLYTQQHSFKPVGEGVPLSQAVDAAHYPLLRTVTPFSTRAANEQRPIDVPKTQRRRVAMMALGVPAIALFVALGAGAVLRKPASPIEEAVAKSLSDPNGATAQVELTRATLAQMGLDPGKSADLGCLAAPTR